MMRAPHIGKNAFEPLIPPIQQAELTWEIFREKAPDPKWH
jgi:hypothetical protein